MLIGTWQATHLLQRDDGPSHGGSSGGEVAQPTYDLIFDEGDTVDLRLEDVSLQFEADGDYTYTSTLDYFETGTFSLDGDILTTAASTDSIPTQRVRVIRLDDGRLHLFMKDAGRNRELGFERVLAKD